MHMADARADICDLMHLYAHHFDDADFESFAGLFEKGTFHLKGAAPPMRGAEEVLDFVRRRVILYDGSPCTNHLMHNHVIELSHDGRRARARSYVQILQGLPDFPLQVIGTGRYYDTFLEENGVWRFDERVGVASLRGDFSHHLRPDTAARSRG